MSTIEGRTQGPPPPESPIQKILEEKEGVCFIPSEFQVEMPETYDHTLGTMLNLPEDYANLTLREAVRYVNLPIVVDPFKSMQNDEREVWKRKILATYGDEGYACISSNKLRINKIAPLRQYLSMITSLSRKYEIRTPKIEALIDIHKRLNDIEMGYRQ